MSRQIRIGSRDSVLAIKQAEIVIASVKAKFPTINFELVKIKTTGDKILDKNLDAIGGKGLFIKELEQALIDGKIDLAVHSYKDMPYEEMDDLPIVALSKRESPFDVLVLPLHTDHLNMEKPIGSCSPRRTIQFNKMYPTSYAKAVRGNVLTRLSKLDKGEYSALILAQAGLYRIGLHDRISRVFTADEMIPSASQGILAIQGRSGENYSYLDCFHSHDSEIISKAERQFLKTLGSDCTSPVAAYAQVKGNEILLKGMYVSDSGSIATGSINGEADEAEFLGSSLAEQLMAKAEGNDCFAN